MELSFAAEKLWSIGSFPVTNTFIFSLLVTVLLSAFAVFLSKRMTVIPSWYQNLAEAVIEIFYGLCEQLAGKRAVFILPWFATFFLFIIIANWLGLFPGVGSIGFFEGGKHFTPLLRPVNSDLNVTLGLAIISVVITHFYSIKTLGIGEYLSRFFSLNPINLFVGLLELISEFTKIASLSFRLFGNVFAGEALLHTIGNITPYTAFIIPLPFMIMETLVGFIQALIFSMLTLVFMVILTTSHNENH
jgi:F-type H+-transporting ATPase subunit a